MASTSNKRWVDYLILGLFVFLCFCLLFESQISPPDIIAWLGKWHPVVLHFPIVLVIVVVWLQLSGKTIVYTLLSLTAFSALIAAISGFLLGLGTAQQGELLFWHKLLGASVAICMTLWYWLDAIEFDKKYILKALSVLILVLIGFTGHYGGMITHGENFLTLPTNKKELIIPENPLIYQHIVAPILDNKCVKCHNPNKTKGALLMTGFDELLKGGESGHTILAGNPGESELMARIELPIDNEDHMPPEGEPQLLNNEIELLKHWIAEGASDTLKLDHLENSHQLAILVSAMMLPDPQQKWEQLPGIADSTIARLASDYLTITRLAANSDALRVAMYKPPKYDPHAITRLQPIADNIVELDLSSLPIGIKEMGLISGCNNLEWLEINNTPIGDTELDTLKILSKIKLLKVYGTDISDKSVAVIKRFEALEKLYLWETNVSNTALNQLKTSIPNLNIYSGINDELKSFFITKDSLKSNADSK